MAKKTTKKTAKKKVSKKQTQLERAENAARMRERRAAARDIHIPEVKDPERRLKAADPREFARTYFHHYCYLPQCELHDEIIGTTAEIMIYGGCDADAMPRGVGKTTTLEIMSLWGIFYGFMDLIGYAAASHPEAMARLGELVHELQTNELLAEDFPEFVVPFVALSGNAQRAKGQTVNGKLTGISMTGSSIVFPDIEGTSAAGQCIITRGIESGLRGAKHRGKRPQFWLVDDPQTRDVARSLDKQVPKVIDTIQRDIIRGGDNRKKIACKALVTIIFEGDVADQLTDRDKHPEWNGSRRQLMPKLPDRVEMWEEYIELYRDDQKNGDRFARRAHAFYIEHRATMDEGSEVAWAELYYGRHMDFTAVLDDDEELPDNPRTAEREAAIRAVMNSKVSKYMSKRFQGIDSETREALSEVNVLPDGSEVEISALQHCYNIIAEQGWDVFNSECQNKPITEAATSDALTPEIISTRLSRMARQQIPQTCDSLVAFIDIHKTPLYWMVLAVENGYPGYIIDYGTYPKTPSIGYRWSGDELMKATGTSSIEASIHQGLDRIADMILREPWRRDDDSELLVDRCLIDSGWGPQTQTIYRWCRMSGLGSVVRPSKGKYVRDSVHQDINKTQRKKRERKGKTPWRQGPAPGDRKARLVSYDANWWKSFCHARLASPVGSRGSISIYGNEGRRHDVLCNQLTSEYTQRVIRVGVGELDEWKLKPGRSDNHYLDCLSGCCVAASMIGVDYDASEIEERRAPKNKRAAPRRAPQNKASPQKKERPKSRPNKGRIRTSY